jgi:predicted tellurium resistance membrane protein TerC
MESVIALLTLVVLEVVLGLDNVIIFSILAASLPQEQQKRCAGLRWFLPWSSGLVCWPRLPG